MLRLIALICFTLGLTFQAAAQSLAALAPTVQCSSAGVQLANLDALKLTEGEQVVAMLETEHGKLEARVNVKGGVVSDPIYYIRGKLLAETPESKVTAAVRACLNPKKTASVGESWYAGALDWLVPSAEAKACRARVLGSGCDGTICCAKAQCGRAIAIWCVYIWLACR